MAYEFKFPRKPKDPSKKVGEIMTNVLSKTQIAYFSYCTPDELSRAVKHAYKEAGLDAS